MYNTEKYKAACKKKKDAVDGLNKLAKKYGAEDFSEIDYHILINDAHKNQYGELGKQYVDATKEIHAMHKVNSPQNSKPKY